MARGRSRPDTPEWREFELLVAKIEGVLAPQGAQVKSPDKVPDYTSNSSRPRDVDASIRYRVGTVDVLITVECRARSRVQEVAWIEQLITKKASIKASKTIAVSSRGFSDAAKEVARRHDIDIRVISEIEPEQIRSWIDFDCVYTNRPFIGFVGLIWKVRGMEELPGLDLDDTEKTKVARDNVKAEVIRHGRLRLTPEGFIRAWQTNFHGTDKDLFAGVELGAEPIEKALPIDFGDDTYKIKTNQGIKALEKLIIYVAVSNSRVRVPVSKVYQYADANNQLAQGVDYAFPDHCPINVSLLKYDSGEFKMRVELRDKADKAVSKKGKKAKKSKRSN